MNEPTPLQRFLDAHGLTQTQLAEGSGMAISQVNGIVRGHTRPRVDTINKLIAYLRTVDPDITFEQLFGEAAA